MNRILAVLLSAIAVLAGSANPAAPLKISPFKAAMTAAAAGAASSVFYIENNSDEPAAVQVSVQKWDMLPDGTEVNADAEDAFTVFPAQVVLKAHERRAVRVQWLGDTMPETEQAFRIVAEQIPITLKDTPASGSGLRFLLRFKAALYIGPPRATHEVSVEKIEPVGSGTLRVTLVNKGSGHTLMRKPVLTLTCADGQTVTLHEKDLTKLAGSNIHAGKIRFFDISVPSGLPSVTAANLVFESAF